MLDGGVPRLFAVFKDWCLHDAALARRPVACADLLQSPRLRRQGVTRRSGARAPRGPALPARGMKSLSAVTLVLVRTTQLVACQPACRSRTPYNACYMCTCPTTGPGAMRARRQSTRRCSVQQTCLQGCCVDLISVAAAQTTWRAAAKRQIGATGGFGEALMFPSMGLASATTQASGDELPSKKPVWQRQAPALSVCPCCQAANHAHDVWPAHRVVPPSREQRGAGSVCTHVDVTPRRATTGFEAPGWAFPA